MDGRSEATIIALATATQNAGIGVIRLSGPQSLSILKTVFLTPKGKKRAIFQPRMVYFGQIVDSSNQILDHGLCFYMPSPHSYTGEDVVELHCHGNIHLLKSVIRRILEIQNFGEVRLAEAGEFSKRAFLNGKMDLTQVEAIHDLISSQSEASVKANLANLDGALSREIDLLKKSLLETLALVEASFEFPEEDIQTYNSHDVFDLLKGVETNLYRLHNAFQTSKLYDVGLKVSLVGLPNVGKSSILNALLNEDRAIVTDIPGTTRDIVQGSKMIHGIRFEFSDTAGLRETSDQVESEGIQRSLVSAQNADLVLFVTDNPENFEAKPLSTAPHLYILNKVDLHHYSVQNNEHNKFSLTISATQKRGITELENLIYETLVQSHDNFHIHVNERQYQKIKESRISVQNLLATFSTITENEILAEELRMVVGKLDEITGGITSHEVLGEIFKRFCIGK